MIGAGCPGLSAPAGVRGPSELWQPAALIAVTRTASATPIMRPARPAFMLLRFLANGTGSRIVIVDLKTRSVSRVV